MNPALLFPGGVGKTGSPSDFTSLIDDVERKVFDRGSPARPGSTPVTATTPH